MLKCFWSNSSSHCSSEFFSTAPVFKASLLIFYLFYDDKQSLWLLKKINVAQQWPQNVLFHRFLAQ